MNGNQNDNLKKRGISRRVDSALHIWGTRAEKVFAIIGVSVFVVTAGSAVRRFLPHDTVQVTIDAQESGRIARCGSVFGSAPVLEGKDLWLGLRREGDGSLYALVPLGMTAGGRYQGRTNFGDTGDAGAKFTLFVFYLDEADSRFLVGVTKPKAQHYDGPAITLYAALPPHRQYEVSAVVTRDGPPNSSPCPG